MTKLLEQVFFGKARLDKENGVVHGVKILGLHSKNGYDYSKRALKEARSLYEGIRVNIDHPDRKNLSADRSYRDRFGHFKNVSFQENAGLIGDFHYNKKHAIAEQFEYDVEHDPKNVGFSHNASGSTVRKGTKMVVESIDALRSVDLVADPATSGGLFESNRRKNMRVRRKQTPRRGRPTNQRVRSEVKRILESVLGEDLSPEKAMMGLIESVLRTEKDKSKIRPKILRILNVHDDDNDVDLAESTKGKGKKMKGQRTLLESKLLERVKRMKHKERIRDLCESMGVRPNAVQLKAMASLESKSEVKQLIESLRSRGDTRKGAKSKEGGEKKRFRDTDKDTREFLESHGLELNTDED